MEGGSPKKRGRKRIFRRAAGGEMEAVAGVICEYDPFHRGHRRQFELIRARLPGARIVCVMSGPFTQRGMPALHAPAVRAQAALEGGADLVLELPCAFSVRDAEHFALGGVSVLSRLGFVTHLSFGVEDGMEALLPAVDMLESPTRDFARALKAALARGASVAAAQGEALSLCLGAPDGACAAWDKPNNILAMCYLRALKRLQSPLIPLPVRREGDYHAASLAGQAWPSATAVRAALLGGDLAAAREACGYDLPDAPLCLPDALDRVLIYKLRTQSAQALSRLPDCSEGLENRLKACAARAATREELLCLLKTRRYARARLSRLCCHALLDVTGDLLSAHPLPTYARLLGLRRGALTAALGQSGIPVPARAAEMDPKDPMTALDMRAYDLWALGAGLEQGLMLTQKVCAV